MKSLFTTALVAFVLTGAAAQELQMDSTTKKWMYRGVIANDSLNSGQLFDRVRGWVALNYKEPGDQVQYENREDGKIVVAGNWIKMDQLKYSDVYRHSLIIEVKDGRIRYTFTDFVIDHKNGFMAGTLEYMENTAIKKHRKQYAERSMEAAGLLENAVKSVKSEW